MRWQELRKQGQPVNTEDLCRDDPDLRDELEREIRGHTDLPADAPGSPVSRPEALDQPKKAADESPPLAHGLSDPAGSAAAARADLEWERVAAELRAYRDIQEQLWGGLDEAAVARYLCGEVTADERRQVEATMSSHPDVHACIALVREVLREDELPPPSTPAP